MITFVTGRPRSGKSFYSVMQLCHELEHSERDIVTNLPLNLVELAEYCHRYIAKPVDLSKRLRVLDDSQVPSFFNYEVQRVWRDRYQVKDEITGKVRDVPDFRERQQVTKGVLYLIDEVHLFYSARHWQSVSNDTEWFMSQHGKLRCDVVLISQHYEKVDKNFRRNAQDYVVIRNLGREKFTFGVSPKNLIRRATYLNLPANGEPPQETGYFKLNIGKYGKLYKTDAGVGLAGRLDSSGDGLAERKGRSPWWLLVPAVLVIGGAFLVPRLISKGAFLLMHSVSGAVQTGASAGMASVKRSANEAKLPPASPVSSGLASVPVAQVQAPVYVVRFQLLSMRPMWQLSDGRVVTTSTLGFRSGNEDGVTIGNEYYPYIPGYLRGVVLTNAIGTGFAK